jgi:hypothetical protein
LAKLRGVFVPLARGIEVPHCGFAARERAALVAVDARQPLDHVGGSLAVHQIAPRLAYADDVDVSHRDRVGARAAFSGGFAAGNRARECFDIVRQCWIAAGGEREAVTVRVLRRAGLASVSLRAGARPCVAPVGGQLALADLAAALEYGSHGLVHAYGHRRVLTPAR